jgi:hypothetical protein
LDEARSDITLELMIDPSAPVERVVRRVVQRHWRMKPIPPTPPARASSDIPTELLDWINVRLNRVERRVCLLILTGMSKTEVAKKMHTSIDDVWQVCRRMRSKWEGYL